MREHQNPTASRALKWALDPGCFGTLRLWCAPPPPPIWKSSICPCVWNPDISYHSHTESCIVTGFSFNTAFLLLCEWELEGNVPRHVLFKSQLSASCAAQLSNRTSHTRDRSGNFPLYMSMFASLTSQNAFRSIYWIRRADAWPVASYICIYSQEAVHHFLKSHGVNKCICT